LLKKSPAQFWASAGTARRRGVRREVVVFIFGGGAGV